MKIHFVRKVDGFFDKKFE